MTIPIGALRIVGLVIYLILGKIAGSDRAKRRLWAHQYVSYGKIIPKYSIALVLLLVFSIMQPLVSVAALIYFTSAIFVNRYQLMYVFREKYQSGGLFQPVVRAPPPDASDRCVLVTS